MRPEIRPLADSDTQELHSLTARRTQVVVLVIRRRRRDIRGLYGDTAMVSGQPVRFPEPQLDNVAYRLDKPKWR